MIEDVKAKVLKEVEITCGHKIICDCCNRVIYDSSEDPNKYLHGMGITNIKYYHLVTGHHDWGNDSIDSVQSLDLCSRECLNNEINKFLDENKSSFTTYFDMETQSQFVSKNTITCGGNE